MNGIWYLPLITNTIRSMQNASGLSSDASADEMPIRMLYFAIIGAVIVLIVVIGVIMVLHEAFTLGSERLPAPQGQALASMIEGILGGNVPVEKYTAGAVLGGMLSAVVGGLGITVGLGFYLPFSIVLTYSLGTLGREIADRYMGKSWSEGVGIPIAAGLIVGEALVGVGYALNYVLSSG